MKIVIIHGQSHHGISYHIGKMLVDNLTNVDAINEFSLPKDLPVFCTGCMVCMERGEEYCLHYQYMKPILKAIDTSDILIFTTPVYCLRTSASMKSFLDHCFTRWTSHRPQKNMFSKKAVVIAVGAGAGMKKAASDIKTSLFYWGISNINIYTFRAMAISFETIPEDRKKELCKDIGKLAVSLKKEKRVSLKVKANFMMMRGMHKNGWSASDKDVEYWQRQGWLDSKRPWKSDE